MHPHRLHDACAVTPEVLKSWKEILNLDSGNWLFQSSVSWCWPKGTWALRTRLTNIHAYFRAKMATIVYIFSRQMEAIVYVLSQPTEAFDHMDYDKHALQLLKCSPSFPRESLTLYTHSWKHEPVLLQHSDKNFGAKTCFLLGWLKSSHNIW